MLVRLRDPLRMQSKDGRRPHLRRHETTEILILTYFSGGDLHEWTPAQGRCEKLAAIAADPSITFVSHGSFERLVWQAVMVEQFGFPQILLGRWRDTTASAAFNRLPLELDRAAKALKLPIEKDKAGSDLVKRLNRQYCRTGVRPVITPECFDRIAKYNRLDVQCLIAIDQMLGPLPDQERSVWGLSEVTNDDGFQNDLDLVHGIMRLRADALAKDQEDFDQIVNAGVTDPNQHIAPTQVKKLRQWLMAHGEELDDLRKDTIKAALDRVDPDMRRVLEVRLEVAAASLKKLDAFAAGTGADGRARGCLVYHGAGTGRWTGRRIQPQNLPKPLIKVKSEQIEDLVAEIKAGDTVALKKRVLKGFTLTDLLVSSLRHVVVARPGMMLAVGDFSQIEACIVLALAKQRDKCELIRNGGDPYRDMGADIYNLSLLQREAFFAALKEALTDEQDGWRAAGKTGVLSCGFAVSGNGLHKKYPWIPLDDCNRIVATYREVWAPLVPKLWFTSRIWRTARSATRVKNSRRAAAPNISSTCTQSDRC
jgi:DNA polymerase bacteriophage-type